MSENIDEALTLRVLNTVGLGIAEGDLIGKLSPPAVESRVRDSVAWLLGRDVLKRTSNGGVRPGNKLTVSYARSWLACESTHARV